ncbi:hypothetical protein E1B28_010317 [Marasmius oreades]|uniref:Uncharacterized protein n=1 Tax=Marasmius oreades TaxID=181124 RepID=A0A9P7RXJ7_9AGAR|nr:uncharacterized protein E1B28_010317 [Marasmius oreades]KAG7091267.1 hypothetical protein E1B28_010317 [Marasmius oreades]
MQGIQVKKWVKSPYIIVTRNDPEARQIKIGGVEYTVPSIIMASEGPANQTDDVTYYSGSEALRGFQSDPGATDRLAVVADISTFPLNKSLPNDYQFSFFTLGTDAYNVSLDGGYFMFINSNLFCEKMSHLPRPFSADNPITVAAYGARCNISTWGSRNYPEVNDNWKWDITAYLRGMNAGGSFDESTFREPQYQIFRTISHTLCTLVGGDPLLAQPINEGNYSYKGLENWFTSAASRPTLTSLGMTELWAVLQELNDSEIQEFADSVEAAFKSIVEQLEENRVTSLVILECDSGVAEFGLSTPGAIIGVGGPLPRFDPTTQNVIGLSETKVRVGEAGQKNRDHSAAFYIVNDGTPIDISVSRDVGIARVTINGVGFFKLS